MNTHRAVIEGLWPSPNMMLIASGSKDHCDTSLRSWMDCHRPQDLKDGERAYVMKIEYQLGHTVFGVMAV